MSVSKFTLSGARDSLSLSLSLSLISGDPAIAPYFLTSCSRGQLVNQEEEELGWVAFFQEDEGLRKWEIFWIFRECEFLI